MSCIVEYKIGRSSLYKREFSDDSVKVYDGTEVSIKPICEYIIQLIENYRKVNSNECK